MQVELIRYSHGKESTLGALLFDGRFQCYTLEDEERLVKLAGETRIPPGRYELALRKAGRVYESYRQRFGFEQGAIEVLEVPGFTEILFHIGNDDDDSAGCVLVGDSVNNNQVEEGFLSYSTRAFKRIYPRLVAAIEFDGDGCWLEIKEV